MPTPLILNRVRETSDFEGGQSNNIILSGAVTNKEPFSNYCVDFDTVAYYADDHLGNWESGIGTYVVISDIPQITRNTVISSSNMNNFVEFGPGTKSITSALDAKIMQQLLDLVPYPYW